VREIFIAKEETLVILDAFHSKFVFVCIVNEAALLIRSRF